MEHRWGRRVAIHLPVRLIAVKPDMVAIGRITNVSLSGAFVADFNFRLFSRIQVTIEPPGRMSLKSLTIAAFVTRNSAQGVGVEWCEWAPPGVRKLIRIVNAQCGLNQSSRSPKPCTRI